MNGYAPNQPSHMNNDENTRAAHGIGEERFPRGPMSYQWQQQQHPGGSSFYPSTASIELHGNHFGGEILQKDLKKRELFRFICTLLTLCTLFSSDPRSSLPITSMEPKPTPTAEPILSSPAAGAATEKRHTHTEKKEEWKD